MFLGQAFRFHHISILHCSFVFVYEYLVPPKTQSFSMTDMAAVHTCVCVCARACLCMQFVKTWARCILTGRVAEMSGRNSFTKCCQIVMKGVCPVTHPPAVHRHLSCPYPGPRLILSDITSLTIPEMVGCFIFRVLGFKEKLAHSDHSGSLLKHVCVLNRFSRV